MSRKANKLTSSVSSETQGRRSAGKLALGLQDRAATTGGANRNINNNNNNPHVKVKSASVGSDQNLPSICWASYDEEDEIPVQHSSGKQQVLVDVTARRALSQDDQGKFGQKEEEEEEGRQRPTQQGPLIQQTRSRAISEDSLKDAASQHNAPGMSAKLGLFSKNFLSLTGPHKPSISTSCLFLSRAPHEGEDHERAQHEEQAEEEEQQKQSHRESDSDHTHTARGEASPLTGNEIALVCVRTKASLSHHWREPKTFNTKLARCRECNQLVYFTGLECVLCGFVAHKKCSTSLVIMCDRRRGPHPNLGFLSPLSVVAASVAQFDVQRAATAVAGQQQQQQQVEPPSSTTTSNPSQSHQNQKPIFGQPVASMDKRRVLDCIENFVHEIDSRGLSSKGIYRVSSTKSKVEKLCSYFDQNPSNLIDLSSFHPNIIANALQRFLRRLPEPLLTNEFYERFIEVAKKYSGKHGGELELVLASNEQQRSQSLSGQETKVPILRTNSAPPAAPQSSELKHIVDAMPPINKEIVGLIMRHLKRVADMADENQMDAKNLSTIFGPTLLSAGDRCSQAIVDNVHQRRAIELMITWAYQIFPPPPSSSWSSATPIEAQVGGSGPAAPETACDTTTSKPRLEGASECWSATPPSRGLLV